MEVDMKFKSIYLLLLIIFAFLAMPQDAVFAQGMKAPDFQVVQPSSHSFSETVAMLKDAIESENLMVLKEIDAQQMLRMVGVKTKGMKQILFFHPHFMKEIIQINKNAGIEPPLKVLVMEKPNGKVMVKYIKPTYIFGKYKGLEKTGEKLEKLVQKIVAQVK